MGLRQIAFKATIINLFALGPVLIAQDQLYVEGTFDLNHNQQSEILIVGDQATPLKYVELDSSGKHILLWHYTPVEPTIRQITDAHLADLNQDNIPELLATVSTLSNDGKAAQPWLLVFSWEGNSFSSRPLTINNSPGAFDRHRPVNLSIADAGITVSLASPSRKALLLNLVLENQKLKLSKTQDISPTIIRSGFGRVFVGSFKSDGVQHLALLSPEGNLLKAAILAIDGNPIELLSDVLALDGARDILGPAIMSYDEHKDGNEELLIPFVTGEVMALSLSGDSLTFSTSAFSKKGLFSLSPEADEADINSVLLARVEEGLYEAPFSREHEEPPEIALVPEDTIFLGDTLDYFVLPDSNAQFYSFSWRQPPPAGMYFNPGFFSLNWVPVRANLGVAQAAYILALRIDEKLVSTHDELGDRHQLTPVLEITSDSLVLLVADTVKEAIEPEPIVLVPPRNYSLTIFSSDLTADDRYQFDAVPPFGVYSDSVPGSVYTTFKANLNSIKHNKSSVFTLKSTVNPPESLVTLSLIHDMENNLVYVSIYPALDSLPQSFKPEDWDPDRYAFPEYFFEGFPNTMHMDSAGQKMRFKAPSNKVQTGSLMFSAPLAIDHHLLLDYAGGRPYAIRGEVQIKENGTYKIITDIDFENEFVPLQILTFLAPAISTPDSLVMLPDSALEYIHQLSGNRIYAPAEVLQPLPKKLATTIDTMSQVVADSETVEDQVTDTLALQITAADTLAAAEDTLQA
ncbi:MAG: hypothetical protein ACE5D2_07855, partial [Fidelibacterota bacterium]